jgi:hypothetical protein
MYKGQLRKRGVLIRPEENRLTPYYKKVRGILFVRPATRLSNFAETRLKLLPGVASQPT